MSSTLLKLDNALFVLLKEHIAITDAVDTYRYDLPLQEVINQDISEFRGYRSHAPCVTCIKECDSVLFPSSFLLLKIVCTVPVTWCECESFASTLRLLNTFFSCQNGSSAQSSLALILRPMHYDMPTDLDLAVGVVCCASP